VGQVALIVLALVCHSACRSPGVFSPDACSLISVKPAPGDTTAMLRFTPNAPYATLLTFANGASGTASPVTASPRVDPACTIAPAPFTPLVSTPVHCATIHWQLDWLLANEIVIGPLPGLALMAR
jgi:hypothetical protein